MPINEPAATVRKDLRMISAQDGLKGMTSVMWKDLSQCLRRSSRELVEQAKSSRFLEATLESRI
jgi:hypothetical protein